MDSSTQETERSLFGPAAGVILTAAGLAGGLALWRQRQARERYRRSWRGRLDALADTISERVNLERLGQIGQVGSTGAGQVGRVASMSAGTLGKVGRSGLGRAGHLAHVGQVGEKAGGIRRAGQATLHGVRAGLGGAWDVAVDGADAVRTRARVMPAITEAASETQSAIGRSLGNLGRSLVAMVTGTLWAALWLGLTGLMAIFIYMPERDQRQRFYAKARRYFAQTRGTIGI